MSKAWITRPLGMFTGVDQTQNFRELGTIFPCRVVRRSERPQRWLRGETLPLPASYTHEGQRHSSAELLASTETAGLLVWQRGAQFSNRSYALQAEVRFFREPEHFAFFREVAARCD